MPAGLLIGAALALACLAYVLYPLVRGGRSQPPPSSAIRRARAPVTDEEIEAAVKAYRATHVVGSDCPVCGRRPETDAVFCSSCGRRLIDESPAG